MREMKQLSKAKIKAARVSDREFDAEVKAVAAQDVVEPPAPVDSEPEVDYAPEQVNLNLAFARLFMGVK